jgi:hypothetical protein
VTAALLLACVVGTEVLVERSRPTIDDEGGVQFSGAAIVIRGFAGEIRGLLADFLWLRVDEYVHHRRIMEGEINAADDEAILPLVRLITWLNPHYVDAYALGAQWLAFHFNKPREAVVFYDEGVRNNPGAAGLITGEAFVQWKLLHDNAAAAAEVEQAAALSDDPLEKFHALWIEAHILLDGGDRAGAIRIWHRVGEIPGYGPTMRYYLKQIEHGQSAAGNPDGGSRGPSTPDPMVPALTGTP